MVPGQRRVEPSGTAVVEQHHVEPSGTAVVEQRHVRPSSTTAVEQRHVEPNPQSINDLSTCLWSKFPIDKCLSC
ncbi:MAG: hypothetical protein PUC53_00070 [Bacteroidales bacterium]|nr:hypothetical protein [Bacteroidales bacterium]